MLCVQRGVWSFATWWCSSVFPGKVAGKKQKLWQQQARFCDAMRARRVPNSKILTASGSLKPGKKDTGCPEKRVKIKNGWFLILRCDSRCFAERRCVAVAVFVVVAGRKDGGGRRESSGKLSCCRENGLVGPFGLVWGGGWRAGKADLTIDDGGGGWWAGAPAAAAKTFLQVWRRREGGKKWEDGRE